MKKKTATRRRGKPQTWLITALLAAIAIAYLVFVFVPGQRSIGELRAQVQERRQQILQSETLIRTVMAARQRLTDTREVGNQWRVHAPKHAQLVTHFANLSHQAEAAAVAIDRLDPVPAVELNLVTRQDVTIQFHAPFAAMFDFLQRLEKLPGTLWIRDLRLHTQSDSNRSLRGEVTLTIFVDRSDYIN